jgi:hypothetical protein
MNAWDELQELVDAINAKLARSTSIRVEDREEFRHVLLVCRSHLIMVQGQIDN